jgi:type I restriction enzyme S subunit
MHIVDGQIVPTRTMTVTESAATKLGEFRLRLGEVILGRRGDMGRCAVVRHEHTGWLCGTGSMIVRPSATVDAGFLQRVLSSPTIISAIEDSSVGSTMINLNQGTLRNLIVQAPSIPEQRAIAAVLSDVDALIAKLDQLIAKKRDLKQAAMQQLLTGKKRLPGFSGEWEEKQIGEVAMPSTERNVAAKKLPVLTCSKHFGFVDSLGFFKNQVFSKDLSPYRIIRRGEIGYPANHVEEGSIGLQILYDEALVSPIYIVFAVTQEINSFFLHRLLKLDSYRQQFKTATSSSVDRRGSLRWPAFSEIKVYFPSLPEQTAIATVLSDMDAEIASLEARRDKTHTIKQGMMQELLTGRIRLL